MFGPLLFHPGTPGLQVPTLGRPALRLHGLLDLSQKGLKGRFVEVSARRALGLVPHKCSCQCTRLVQEPDEVSVALNSAGQTSSSEDGNWPEVSDS